MASGAIVSGGALYLTGASGSEFVHPLGSHYVPHTGGTWVQPTNTNVMWQTTTSNATYCSASNVLK